MNDLIQAILDNKFHAVSFRYKGTFYGFAGWWILYWGDEWDEEKTKEYDTKDEFLQDRIFDGRTLEEAQADITDIDLEFEPE
jgi:hypothetical protein